MKSMSTATILFTLLTAASAADVTVSIANDQSGANAGIKIPEDGVARSIQSLWDHTSIAQNGVVYGSSAQFTAFQTSSACRITQAQPAGNVDSSLNAQRTWVSFENGHVVNLAHAWIVCHS